MRKTQKTVTALLLSAVMATSLICTPALAADTKTVQINGYTDDKTPAEIAAAKPQLEISGVVSDLKLDKSIKMTAKTDEGEELWTKAENIDAAYNAAAPVTIKTLDNGGLFEVYKLTEQGNILNFDFGSGASYSSGKLEVEDSDGNKKTIDAGSLSDDDYLVNILPGCAVTLTEPGAYYVLFKYESESDSSEVIVNVGDSGINLASFPKVTAGASSAKAIIDGKNITFDAYLIGGNNYVKLRDFAKAINGSPKQFEVTWDGPSNAILLASRLAYTSQGDELKPGDGKSKDAVPCDSKILQDGTEIALVGYRIGESNYFKLRDLAKAFNIGVTWYGETNSIGIDTSSYYSD